MSHKYLCDGVVEPGAHIEGVEMRAQNMEDETREERGRDKKAEARHVRRGPLMRG